MGAPKAVLAAWSSYPGRHGDRAIPLLGDVFDVAFKSNRRNLDLLQRSLGEKA